MKKVYFLLIAFVGLLNSCGLYRQNVINVPLFQEKGQVHVGGHIGFTGCDGQVAASLMNNLAVIGSYSFLNNSTNYSNTNYTKLHHQFYEFGVGHFRKNSKDFIHEYFILYGEGKTDLQSTSASDVGQSTRLLSSNYSRFTVQADFGKVKEAFEYSFTPRVFWINYYGQQDTQNTTYQTIPHAFVWSDVAFSVRYSPLRFIKIMGQVAMTLPVTGRKYGYYEASPLNASIGLVLNVR